MACHTRGLAEVPGEGHPCDATAWGAAVSTPPCPGCPSRSRMHPAAAPVPEVPAQKAAAVGCPRGAGAVQGDSASFLCRCQLLPGGGRAEPRGLSSPLVWVFKSPPGLPSEDASRSQSSPVLSRARAGQSITAVLAVRGSPASPGVLQSWDKESGHQISPARAVSPQDALLGGCPADGGSRGAGRRPQGRGLLGSSSQAEPTPPVCGIWEVFP